jgi:hypothetical protein
MLRDPTRCQLVSSFLSKHPAPMPHAPLQPGSQATFTLRGYAVIVRVDSDTVHHVTCSDLPQLSVSDGSLSSALSRAEVAIDAILAGEFASSEEAR